VHRHVLALDTSSAAVTAAVVALTDERCEIAAERQHVDPRGHAEHLAPLIADCLQQAGATTQDLAAIVAGVGPGPYTGLRVGLVTAAVMSDVLGVPSYGVCSLDGIAGRHPDVQRVLVAGDARRKEIYWAMYQGAARVTGPHVDRPDAVPLGRAEAMAGAGARMYADRLGLPLLDGDYPDPKALVLAARTRILGAEPSEALTPLYLRRPDAVVPSGRPKAVLQ
jgi:tRNA threonylcarbamoyl adenosine modification protein YeaZ